MTKEIEETITTLTEHLNELTSQIVNDIVKVYKMNGLSDNEVKREIIEKYAVTLCDVKDIEAYLEKLKGVFDDTETMQGHEDKEQTKRIDEEDFIFVDKPHKRASSFISDKDIKNIVIDILNTQGEMNQRDLVISVKKRIPTGALRIMSILDKMASAREVSIKRGNTNAKVYFCLEKRWYLMDKGG